MSAGAFNSATSTDPSKGTPDSLWSAWRQSCLSVAICFWCQSFLFLSVQLVRQMEPCICHCGSISGLGFLGIISFNGTISLSLSFFVFCLSFSHYVWSICFCSELKCSDVLAPKNKQNKSQSALTKHWEQKLWSPEWCLEYNGDSAVWGADLSFLTGSSCSACSPFYPPPSPLISSLCLAYLVLLFSSKSGHPVPNFPLANNFQLLTELGVLYLTLAQPGHTHGH